MESTDSKELKTDSSAPKAEAGPGTESDRDPGDSTSSSVSSAGAAESTPSVHEAAPAPTPVEPSSNAVPEECPDYTTPCWFYLDAQDQKQGPFSFKDIYVWLRSGYFLPTTRLRNAWDEDYRPLGQIPDFTRPPRIVVERIEQELRNPQPVYFDHTVAAALYSAPTPTQPDPAAFPSHAPRLPSLPNLVTATPLVPSTPGLPQQPQYAEYAVTGGFTKVGGRFSIVNGGEYFERRGLPADRAERMMAHFFDYEAYQEQMRAAHGDDGKPSVKKKNAFKGDAQYWKDYKQKKKHAKLMAEYRD